MTVEVTTKDLPRPVIRRLPKYLTHVHQLRLAGQEWVSSLRLADALGLTSSTVRQDLSHLDLAGVSKRGYATGRLEFVIQRKLGTNLVHRLVIVGAGYLGCALALHGDLHGNGFEVVGVFDSDVELIGTPVGNLRVRPMDSLDHVVKDRKAELGLIAVPASAAQSVADRLVAAGIHGLLNLTYTHIQVPEYVTLIDARLIASLQELAYVVRAREESVLAETDLKST